MWKYGFKKSQKALKKVDAVVLGGGGLFQDSYLLACFIWAWQIFWVKRYKKPLFIYGTGVGPLRTRVGKWLTKWAYSKAAEITVRDRASAELLEKIGLSQEIQVTTDPVFAYSKPNITKSRTKNLFIVNLRPWLNYNEKIIKSFSSFLERLKNEKEAELIFVSMQQIKEDDLRMIEPIVSRLGGEILIPGNFSDLLQIMEGAEFAIGMRYHFMIAALITQTPLLPISYSPKTAALLENSPLKENLIRVEELSEHRLHEGLKKLSIGYNNAIIYAHALAVEQADLARSNENLLKRFISV
ncbi:MAG: polysaccharide pyruvyl transferase family protein, partial [Candidatus Peregrinibacteria bacterium]|nr:polysaccharide pyruvyl transferase family protein [Candidatus Peregrinibacteria bacterium]